MQQATRQQQIEENFHAFQGVVSSYLPQCEGKFALLHDKEVVEVFADIIDAVVHGNDSFGDGHFSVQRITDKLFDLGFLSHVTNERLII